MDGPIKVKYDPETDNFTTCDDWNFNFKGRNITITCGYCFKASIPRTLWNIVGPNDLGLTPVLIHDYLYEHRGVIGDLKYTRQDVDDIFMEQMKLIKVPWHRRMLAYLVVRTLGWTYYYT